MTDQPVDINAKFTPRVFSGIQPSGNLTLGNYLGALKRFAEKQDQGVETIYCLVDLHAVTVWQEPEALKRQTREAAAAFIASGIDPARSILFNQGQVSAHAELGWLMMCVARVGWMNRMTQFKDKAGKNAEKVSLGLYAYPALMAADILAYHATMVPVGEDQKQHVELTRDIAAKFNHDYGVEFFPSPVPLIEGARRAGLPVHGPDLAAARYLDLMASDKKVEGGRLRLVLLRAIGRAVIHGDADVEDIAAAIEARRR